MKKTVQRKYVIIIRHNAGTPIGFTADNWQQKYEHAAIMILYYMIPFALSALIGVITLIETIFLTLFCYYSGYTALYYRTGRQLD